MTSQPLQAFQGLRKATGEQPAYVTMSQPSHAAGGGSLQKDHLPDRFLDPQPGGQSPPGRLQCGHRCPGRRPQLGAGQAAPWRGRESAMNGPRLLAHHGLLRAPAQLTAQQPGLTGGKRWGGASRAAGRRPCCACGHNSLPTSGTGEDLSFNCSVTLHTTNERDCSDRAARSAASPHTARRQAPPYPAPHPHRPAQEQQAAHTQRRAGGRAGGRSQLCLLGRTSWAPCMARPALEQSADAGQGRPLALERRGGEATSQRVPAGGAQRGHPLVTRTARPPGRC